MVELGGVGWTGNQAGRDLGEDGPTRAEQSRAGRSFLPQLPDTCGSVVLKVSLLDEYDGFTGS